MKLLNKTALYNFLLSLFVMLAGLACFYVILQKFVNEDATEKLYIQRQRVERQLPLIDSIPANSRVMNNDMQFVKIPSSDNLPTQLIDTILHETYDDEDVPYRILTCTAHSKLYNYRVTISQSLIESHDLMRRISRVLVLLLIIYLIAMVVVNRFIAQRLWRPFYNVIAQLKFFDVQQNKNLQLTSTGTEEFNLLNTALGQMTERIKTDYKNLKEFSENASHEIQTPLAIIRSKIELMMQAENLSEQQWKSLNTMAEAVTRLSRLTQSLLLLSKIDNGQFHQTEKLDFSLVLRKHIENFAELINAGQITLQQNISDEVFIHIHPYLLDILLSNLLMNAIRHNTGKHFISITLGLGMFKIENSGDAPTVDIGQLFTRFKKGDNDQDSVGIGLSLVKKISSSNHIELAYNYQDNVHTLSMQF